MTCAPPPYRYWRDSHYVIGALLAPILTDRIGIDAAIASGVVATAVPDWSFLLRLREALHPREGHQRWAAPFESGRC